MDDYSLVPVEHQPEFLDASSFSANPDTVSGDGATQQPQDQPGHTQPESLPPSPATGTHPGGAVPGFGQLSDTEARSGHAHRPDLPTHQSAAPQGVAHGAAESHSSLIPVDHDPFSTDAAISPEQSGQIPPESQSPVTGIAEPGQFPDTEAGYGRAHGRDQPIHPPAAPQGVAHGTTASHTSSIPVPLDPSSVDAAIPPAQPGQKQPEHPQPLPAIGIAQHGVGARAAESGESLDLQAEDNSTRGPHQPSRPATAPVAPPDNSSFKPFGELKPATYTPTQQIGNFAADVLMGLGMQPYIANDLTSRVGNLLGLTPLGEVGSALDLIDAKRRDDFPGVLTAAVGMIPGGRGAARSAVRKATDGHHPWPKYLGGAVKQELIWLPRDLHQAYHAILDEDLPRWVGTAYYDGLGAIERWQVLQTLADRTKKFDAENGTKLYDGLLKNGFPAP